MVKSPPEKLAAALRANLKRRKSSPAPQALAEGPLEPAKAPATPVEKSPTRPSTKG